MGTCRASYKSIAFQQIEAELSDNIILALEDLRYPICYPSRWYLSNASYCVQNALELVNLLFHHLDVDLGHVNLLTELCRELGGLEQLQIYRGSHFAEADVVEVRRDLVVTEEVPKRKCLDFDVWIFRPGNSKRTVSEVDIRAHHLLLARRHLGKEYLERYDVVK